MKKFFLILLCFVVFNATANSEHTLIEMPNCELNMEVNPDVVNSSETVLRASLTLIAISDPCGCDSAFIDCVSPGNVGTCLTEYLVCVWDCIWPF